MTLLRGTPAATRESSALLDVGASIFLLIVGMVSFRHVLDLPMTALDSYPIVTAAAVDGVGELPSVLGRELRGRVDPGWSYYRPLTLLTYSVDYLNWGLDPRGYHWTNLSLHGLAGVAVFWLLRIGFAMSPLWAIIGSLIFLLHPATVEVVPAANRRQEPLLVIGFATTIIGARGVLAHRRFAWILLLAGTLFTVTSCERGLVIPAGLARVSKSVKQRGPV